MVKNLVKIIFLRSCKIYKHYTTVWEPLKNLLIFMYFLMHPLKNLLKLQWTFIKYKKNLFKKWSGGGAVPPCFCCPCAVAFKRLALFSEIKKLINFDVWNTPENIWRKGHSRSQKRRLSTLTWKVTTEPIL